MCCWDCVYRREGSMSPGPDLDDNNNINIIWLQPRETYLSTCPVRLKLLLQLRYEEFQLVFSIAHKTHSLPGTATSHRRRGGRAGKVSRSTQRSGILTRSPLGINSSMGRSSAQKSLGCDGTTCGGWTEDCLDGSIDEVSHTLCVYVYLKTGSTIDFS